MSQLHKDKTHQVNEAVEMQMNGEIAKIFIDSETGNLVIKSLEGGEENIPLAGKNGGSDKMVWIALQMQNKKFNQLDLLVEDYKYN